MKTSSLFPLLTIASIAQGLPFEGVDSPLTPRNTGNTGQWADPATAVSSTPTVAPGADSGQWKSPNAVISPALPTAVPSAAPSAVPYAAPSAVPYAAPPAVPYAAPPVVAYSPPVDVPVETPSGGSGGGSGGGTGGGSDGGSGGGSGGGTGGGSDGGSGGGTGGASYGSPGSTQYTLYKGDGKDWPSQEKWVKDFDTMFKNNKELMKNSCAQWSQALNSETEMQDIHSGIIAQSQSSGVDERVILAIILQESKGCVRVISTNNGVYNPGLMQSHAGISCTETPCPTAKIHQMIQDGTSGTASGDGLKQTIQTAKTQGAAGSQAVYWGARIYNTGTYVTGTDLNEPLLATKCYCTDVANWLTGWNGQNTGCHLDNQ